jgi:hypothetical protein
LISAATDATTTRRDAPILIARKRPAATSRSTLDRLRRNVEQTSAIVATGGGWRNR